MHRRNAIRWALVVATVAACSSTPHPAGECSPEERCGDGIDNDCDGMIDEGCECTPGDIQACGVGVCAGEQMCEAGVWSQCYGGTPSPEICDGKDNDCNGLVDDGDANACGGVCDLGNVVGDPCDGPGDTDLCKEATWQCDGLNALTCPDMTSSTVEICGDHIDNNCDGRVDEFCSGGHLLWEDHSGSPLADASAQANDVAVGSDGSIYVVGTHREVATFGGTVTWDPGSSPDGFVAKYSSTGQLIWHHPISGPGDGDATAIAIDSDGSLVVAGNFGDPSVQFSPTVSVTSVGYHDAFVARYLADGTFVQVATFASDDDDTIADLAISPSGQIAITGNFYGSAFHVGPFTVPRAGNNFTYFTAVLDSAFTPVWAHRLEWSGTTTGPIGGNAVTFDAAGHLYVGGSTGCYTNCTTPMLAFNRGEPDELAVPGATQQQGGGFLARFDASGHVEWATAPASVGGIAVTGTTVFATGQFPWTATFGLGQGNATTLFAGGSYDAWIGRYESDGTFDWVRQLGSPTTCSQIVQVPDDNGLGIAIDATGNAIITGTNQATMVFSPELSTVGDGYGNAFWASYDPTGAVLFGHVGEVGESGCTGGGGSNRVAIAPDGDIILVGEFNNHMILPDAVMGGPHDFFVAAFSSGE